MKKVTKMLACSVLAISVLVSIVSPVSANSFPFTDVSEESEYYEAIEYCYSRGIIYGTSPTTFSPTATLNRAMMVTLLYRMSGSSMKRAPTGFTDVPTGSYYYYAVGWAQYYNVVYGVSTTSFAPLHILTREPTISLLYRYATAYKGVSFSLISSSYANNLSDYSSISTYAKPAVNWALNCGIIKNSTTTFFPCTGTSRQSCALFLYQYLSKVDGSGKAYSMRSLSVGTAAQISEIISAMNYPSCTGYDLTRREMQFALRNSKVLFSHSHGANSYLVLADGNLQSTSIAKDSLTQLQLVYVSACNSGNEFVPALYNTGGAASAVGFKNTITASSSNDGIHFFNLRFFYHLSTGCSIGVAIRRARQELLESYGSYAGSDAIVFYGSFS